MSWEKVLGRVSFINCDPVFHGIGEKWNILAAPPSWLTGHLLRRDCITAPIPTADFALHHDKLVLLPKIGIVGREKVGSVLLFGNREIDSMRDIALPSDSSTSRMLMHWILKNRKLENPKKTLRSPPWKVFFDDSTIIKKRDMQHHEIIDTDLEDIL